MFGFVSNGQKGSLQTTVDDLTKQVSELKGKLETAEGDLAAAKGAAEAAAKEAADAVAKAEREFDSPY